MIGPGASPEEQAQGYQDWCDKIAGRLKTMTDKPEHDLDELERVAKRKDSGWNKDRGIFDRLTVLWLIDQAREAERYRAGGR